MDDFLRVIAVLFKIYRLFDLVVFVISNNFTLMSRKKIVIIDDEEDLCQLMKAYFLDLNHDVFLANTLNSGLSLMKEVSPDVVFIDNNLPDGLGWEKMSYLMDEYPGCKINLISAYEYLPPDLKNRENHTVTILEKPLRLNALRDYI